MDETVRQREITRDIDSYISGKRRTSWFGFGKNKDAAAAPATPVDAGAPDAMPAEVAEGPASSMVVEDTAAEQAAAQATVAEPKKGFFSRMFGSKEEPAAPVEISAEPADDQDVRELARITLTFLRMTDEDALASIKKSQDFEKFKDILRKRQIIK